MRTLFSSIVLSSLALAGCASVFNGAPEATTAEERHPITVDRQTVTVRIPVDPTLAGLSRGSLAKIDAFVTSYRTRGYGPITVTAPSSGNARDVDGHQTAADVRTALFAYGLPYEEMRGASYRTTDKQRDVLLTFNRYVASAPVCGTFEGERASRLRNVSPPNFGCANQANFAAMVADPRDLTAAQATGPASGSAAAAAIRATQTGTNDYDDGFGVGARIGGGNE